MRNEEERGAETLIPFGPQRCEWRNEVGDPTWCLRISLAVTCWQGAACLSTFFFHEYGRRVGMVPRSSLKGRVLRAYPPFQPNTLLVFAGLETQMNSVLPQRDCRKLVLRRPAPVTPASRDQLTDQAQCEAAKPTRVRKSCPLTALKAAPKDFRVRTWWPIVLLQAAQCELPVRLPGTL